MSELVERQFPAKALLTGLRAIGYNFSTAVADIIDNSISAGASEIYMFSDPLSDVPYFCILDNGSGMSVKQLDNAMLPGSDRTEKEDSKLELGRFGLGLKSASLSQCREFTVATKQNGAICAMSFDLDVIEDKNKLMLKQLSEAEIVSLPKIEKLQKYDSGTLVIWTKFDKIEELAKNFEDSFRSVVAESKKHVELVFHRFYNQVDMFYNDKRIERRDPFLLSSIGRQQTGRTSIINIGGSEITVTPYTLPFANTLTEEEKKLLGNPRSLSDEQGFYLYRNERLISWGSWMHMGIRSELNKLARIQVDVPSTLDSVWMLDVKKSSAKIPDKIKDRIKMAVEDSIVRSKKTTKFPGVKEQSVEVKIWDRIEEHEGHVRYQINRDNPLIKGFYNVLDNRQADLFDDLICQLEQCIPKYRIHNDVIDSVNIVNDARSQEEEEMMAQVYRCLELFPEREREATLSLLLTSEAYSKILHRKEEMLGVLRNGKQ